MSIKFEKLTQGLNAAKEYGYVNEFEQDALETLQKVTGADAQTIFEEVGELLERGYKPHLENLDPFVKKNVILIHGLQSIRKEAAREIIKS